MGGKDLRAVLSYNIKLYRGHHAWSQADLAEKANISITFLSNIERGIKWPYPDTLTSIAQALGVEVFELFRQGNGDNNDTATLIDRFVKDITMSVNHSIDLTYRNYRKGLVKQQE